MMRWLEEKPEPRPGESPSETERRTRWSNRANKGFVTWELVLPAVALVIVCVVLAVQSLT